MEDKIRISGIIFEHGKDDDGWWEGFNLTEDEENQSMEILINHDTEDLVKAYNNFMYIAKM